MLDDRSVNIIDGLNVTLMEYRLIHTESRESSDVLLEEEVDIVTNKEYQTIFETLTETMICASREGKDSCQGWKRRLTATIE